MVSPQREPQPKRLLLVDDDAVALAALSEGLGRRGYSVATAPSGEDALRIAQTSTFDLALLDMRLPGISGAALAKQLQGNFGTFSVILSGCEDFAAVQEAIDDGALGYLLKPFDVARLVPTIEASLARAKEMSSLLRGYQNLSKTLQEGRETSIATGILMERLRLDRNTAFVRLRDAARTQRRRVSHLAEDILKAAELLNRGGES